MKLTTLAAAAIGALTLGLAGQASATTVDFSYLDGADTVASGSFSYATGDTGVLGYGDLSAFDVTVVGETFTLADVQTTLTANDYFAYDTAGPSFVSAGPGFFDASLAATSPGVGQGFGFFYLEQPGGDYENYGLDRSGGFTDVVFSTDAAPEPETWALMILGVGVVGLSLRKPRRQALA